MGSILVEQQGENNLLAAVTAAILSGTFPTLSLSFSHSVSLSLSLSLSISHTPLSISLFLSLTGSLFLSLSLSLSHSLSLSISLSLTHCSLSLYIPSLNVSTKCQQEWYDPYFLHLNQLNTIYHSSFCFSPIILPDRKTLPIYMMYTI